MKSQNPDMDREKIKRKLKEEQAVIDDMKDKKFEWNMRLDHRYIRTYARLNKIKLSRLQKTISRLERGMQRFRTDQNKHAKIAQEKINK